MFREISSAVHEAITGEFEQDWRTYSSPTRASIVLGDKYGVSAVTVRNILKRAGLWPVMPARDYTAVVAENGRLKQQIHALRQQLDREHG